MKEIVEMIMNNQSFVISSHRSPDGDAIGSCVSLGLALKKLGKTVTYVMEKPQEKFDFLHEIIALKENNNSLDTFDVGLFLDCSNTEHLHKHSLFSSCNCVINIDHHVTNANYGHINYIKSSASATGEIMYTLIKELKVPLDEEIAAAIYTAIVTDTGNFKYSNVTSETHYIVSELYKVSDCYCEINKKIFDEHSYDKIKILGKALNNLYLMNDNKISIILLPLEDLKCISANADLEGIINYARDIEGVEVAIFMKETNKNVYRVSFRSNTDYNVSKIADYYGGGGHNKAAGCTIEGTSSQYIISNIISKIAKDLK